MSGICPSCGRRVAAAATTCGCGADLRLGGGRAAPHPWWGPVAICSFFLGWAAEAFIDAQNTGSTGTGFGNLGVTVFVILVGAFFAFIGLAMLMFRDSRPAGSLLAAGGGGLAVGVVFGFLMLY